MLSECKIDGTVLAQFRSPDVIPRPAYRQSFFVSEAFSIGRHQLAIRNPGGDFYFDAIILKFPASSTSLPSVIPTASTASPVPPQSISPVSPSTVSSTQFPPSLTLSTPTTRFITSKGRTG